jgi:hypothetical protein
MTSRWHLPGKNGCTGLHSVELRVDGSVGAPEVLPQIFL